MSVDEQDVVDDVAEIAPDQGVETNGNAALRRLHELDDDASTRVVEWIIGDQDPETCDVPTVDDVVDTIDRASVALAFDGSVGFAYVKPLPAGEYLHYKRITDREKVAAVAEVENRDPDDVRLTKAVIDSSTVRDWIHLAIDTRSLSLADLDELDVFDDEDAFTRGR